jgi:DNA-directed RNA polymerase subunit F
MAGDEPVTMEEARAIVRRHEKGKPLTFEDGLALAYAIQQRLSDDLEFVVADGDDAEDMAELCGHVFALRTSTRLVYENVTEIAVPPELKPAPIRKGGAQ